MQFTFEQLPQAVTQLYGKLNQIERLLQNPLIQTAPPETDRWYSIDEVCDYLPGKPAKATIYGKVHNREIPHKKVGKRLAFPKSEIDQWLKAQRRKTASEIDAEANAFIISSKKEVKTMQKHNLKPKKSLFDQDKDTKLMHFLNAAPFLTYTDKGLENVGNRLGISLSQLKQHIAELEVMEGQRNG